MIITVLAGGQQILSSLRRRRYRRAEEVVLEKAVRALDAEAARGDYDKMLALRETLRRQIDDEVPREARRVYLRARLDVLRDQIGRDVDEYQELETEMAKLESRPPTALDARIRPTIERAISPAYVRERRTQQFLVIGLAILLLLTITPFPVAFGTYSLWKNYASPFGAPSDATVADLLSSAAFGALALAVTTAVLLGFAPQRRPRWLWRHPYLLSAVACCCGALLVLPALQQRSVARRQFAIWNSADDVYSKSAIRADVRGEHAENVGRASWIGAQILIGLGGGIATSAAWRSARGRRLK